MSSVVTSAGRNRDSTSGGCSDASDTSVAIKSDDDFGSLGNSYEKSKPGAIPDMPQTSSNATCSQVDPESPNVALSADSPAMQTFAASKQEAVEARRQRGRTPKGRFKSSTNRASSARRRVSRTCKVMKEAYFRGMAWARTFVSRPCASQMESV